MDRYDLCLGYNHDGSPYATAEISPYNDGEWVKYSDVESLQARVRELEVGLDVLHRIAIGALGNPINDCTKYLNEIASRARSLKGTP